MKVQGHLRDYPLPLILEVLADRRESGCLRIAFEPEPAILHFKRGQLVDARMSLLQGAAALKLALSLPEAPFDFDNEIVAPQSGIDNHERAVLSRLFGVRLSAPGESETSETLREPADISLAEPSMRPWSNSAAEIINRPPLEALKRKPELERNQKEESSDNRNYSGDSRQTFSYLSQQRLLRTAVMIIVVAVPAAVGITVRFGKRIADPAHTVSARQAPGQHSRSAPPSSADLDGTRSPAAQGIDANPAATMPSISEEDTKRPPTTIGSEPTKTIAESGSSKVISNLTKVTGEAGLVPDSPNTYTHGPEARLGPIKKTIVVEIQIEAGRITEAWIQNPRKGLEAFEAMALRVVRQRRYDKALKGKATVSVNVTVNQ